MIYAINDQDIEELKQKAMTIATKAYVPYSKVHVGAALLCSDSKIITGCNIENRAYSLCICAERTAIVKALSEDQNKFVAIAIFSPEATSPLPPCGACREVLSEFVSSDFPVFLGCPYKWERVTFGQLLPMMFNEKLP